MRPQEADVLLRETLMKGNLRNRCTCTATYRAQPFQVLFKSRRHLSQGLIRNVSFIYWFLILNWPGLPGFVLCLETDEVHVSWFFVFIFPTITAGIGVSVQVYRPVSHPVLKSHLRDGGGAVQSEYPGALPVDPLCPESGQPQLGESGVHSGQTAHNSGQTFPLSAALKIPAMSPARGPFLSFVVVVFQFSVLFILLVCIHISLLDFFVS